MDEKHKRPAFNVHPDAVLPGQPAPDTIEVTAPPDEPTEECVVAQGRCIHVNDGQLIQHGYDLIASRPVYRQGFRPAGPGEKVTLARSEAKRLRATGHVHDESKIAPLSVTNAQELQDGTLPGRVSKAY